MDQGDGPIGFQTPQQPTGGFQHEFIIIDVENLKTALCHTLSLVILPKILVMPITTS
ncbi:hypothetical protein [Vibrio coralliilyticus]|uniref:hypothetical protein n=1 Tax=Vibrio coralliilyticus TaxID=190893 RepID=UPI001EE70C29|nr:hypothetical protein [Vibrio coralliilyticus]